MLVHFQCSQSFLIIIFKKASRTLHLSKDKTQTSRSSFLFQALILSQNKFKLYRLSLNLNITMSYQKKSLILQQIEQAIRKKAQQKSRTKQHVGRVLQNSIQKKKNVMRSTITKDQKVASIHKNQNYQEIQKGTDKHISLFNNQQLNTLEGDLKIKKYNNRRLDKLVSLIQYMVSSSEKAIKYISSTNFEAEFALKLYRSDKQNLLSQLKNLTIEDFLESYRGNEKNSGSKNEANYSLLVEENNKLKKDILVLEKEAQRFMKGSLQEKQPIQMKVIEREAAKLKQTIRKLIPFDSFKKYVDILDKETKFESMELKCQDSSKKVAEIQMVVASLQNQRNAIIQNINRNRGDPKSQRTFKMNQIQGQKEQLQKQINALKSRVNQMKQSSKLIEQYELFKRQNQINNQKLTSLANELSNGTFAHGKRGTQSLVDFIRIKTKDFIMLQRKQQQQIENSQIEREQLQLLIKQKSEELSTFHQRMENIHCEVQNLRENIEQLNNQKMQLLERCRESEALLQNRQNQILILNQKLKNTESREEDKQDIRMKNNQLRKELQNLTKRQEEKQKWLKQKIHSLQGEKQQLEDKLMQLQQFMNHKNDEIEQLIKQKDSKEDSTLVIIEKMKIQAKKEINELKETIESLQLQLENQTLKYQQLIKVYEQSNDDYKELTQSYNQKHQQLKELEDLLNDSQKRIEELQNLNKKLSKSNDMSEELLQKINELQMENTHLESERQRVKKQNEANIQKLRTIQQQIIKNNYSLQELNNTKNQNVKLNQMVSNLKKEIDQIQKNQNKSKDSTDQLQQTIDKLSDKLKQKQSQVILNLQAIKSLQHLIEQNQERYQKELSEQSKKLQQAQITSIKLNKQKAQIEQNLKDEQDKNQQQLHKIQKLQRQIQELKSEMRSLTIISNEVISQKEQSINMLNHLEEQKLKLQEELNSTKQQIENQIEINQYKAQQYTYLLRQILKGINIQTTDYEHIKTFEELLEFGSKEVVEMRKRQRQQQSNRRRNNKRQQQYNFIEDSDSPTFQNYKTNLFQADGSSNNKNLQLKDLHQSNQNDKLQLNEFQDMRSQKANDSMMSEDNKYGMQEFDDLKSQKMNDSMLSNKEANQAQYQTNLLNNQNILNQEDQIISQEKRQQILNLLNQNSQNDQQPETNDAWKLGIDYKPKIVEQVAQLGQFQSQLSSIPHAAQTIHLNSDRGGSQTQQIANQLASLQAATDFKIDQYQEVNSEQEQIKQKEVPKVQDIFKKQSKQQSGVSDFIARSNDSDVVIYPLHNFKQKSSEQNLRQSQHNSASEFEQFNDMKVGIDNSMISQKPLNFSQLNDIPADNPNASFISNQNESNLPLDIEQFGEMKNEQMNQSLLSNQHQDKQHEMDEFGDLKEEPMNQSMLSEKEHGLSQFGDLKSEAMNQSMLSQKEHNLQQFGDFKEEPMNQSMLSQKQQKQHGLFQFGELKQEMNQSMFSQKQQQNQKGLSDFGQFPEQNLINSSMISNQKRSLSKGQSEGNNLDDFDEVKSDRMNDSIISEK